MKSEDADECCYSRTELNTYTYKWVITQFLDRPEGNCEYLTSSKFKSNDSDEHCWHLRCYPHGDTRSNGYISLFLVREINVPQILHHVTFKLYVINTKGEKLYCRSTKYPECPNAKQWGWGKHLKKEDLNDDLLPNGDLTIFCTLTTSIDKQYTEKPIFKIPECRMAEKFGDLLLGEEFSDITLSVKGQDFKVHKAILAAQSPVFAAMFKHNMQEVKKNQVTIIDIEPEVFQQCLQFIYTGSSSNIKEFCDKLLAVSDKYCLDRLKALCEEALGKRLTVENAAETLMVADLHSAQQLADKTIAFISFNYAAVKQTSGWKSLEMNLIIQKLIEALSKTTREPENNLLVNI